MMKRIALIGIMAASLAACGPGEDVADLILTGGTVWTGAPAMPSAEAVAVRGNRIVAVGSAAEIGRLRGEETRVIDLAGRQVVPGLADGHTHFISGGFQLGSVDLRDAASPAELTRRIGAFARSLPPGRWITGGDWDHEAWPGGPLPRREWIDSVTAEHPVLVSRLDGHMALANTRALELAGVTRETADPPGGTIVRDPATGEPTGVLKDEAMGLVGRVMPEDTEAERDEAFDRAQRHALELGVTMITDMGSWDDLATYRRAAAADRLKLRIHAYVPLATWARLRDFVHDNGTGDDRLKWGGLKGFVDGSLGSTTAWFHEPFTDEPGTSGLMVTDTADLRAWIVAADSAGLQVAVHAIGDRANDWILDTYAWVAEVNGRRDRRFRIEHAQHLTAAAIPRFARQHVIASMQPYHAIDDGRWAEKRIGPERIRTTYAFRSLLDAGARLAFGSDWTVAPNDPLLGIYAAATRRTPDGQHPAGWVPEQKIGVDDALRAYTTGNAYAAFMEDRLGTIEADRLADMVVLSGDIRAIDPADIPNNRVDYTIIDGEVVFSRKSGIAPRAR